MRGVVGTLDAVAARPDGRNVYAVSGGGAYGSVLSLSRDPQTGFLAQMPGTSGCHTHRGQVAGCAAAAAVAQPSSVIVTRDGRNVYVTSSVSSGVAAFRRDPATGALTQLPGRAGCVTATGSGGACATAPGLVGTIAIAASPNGKRVYVAAADSRRGGLAVFARATASGALTAIGCVRGPAGPAACAPARAVGGPTGVAVSGDGRHLYATTLPERGTTSGVAVFRRSG